MADTSSTKVGLFDFLENHLSYKIKLLIPLVLVGLFIFGWNKIRDLETQVAENVKVQATLQQNFQQLGSSAVTHNELQTQKQVDQQATQLFGQQVMDTMKAEKSHLDGLTMAVGSIAGTVNGLQTQVTNFKPGQQVAETGALTGYPLEENRGKLPALSALSLFYNPKEIDPNKAFAGTQWHHYNETFNVTSGQWEQDKTHGYKTTVKLSRTVTKPDPNDPTKMVVIGQEDIPVTSGDTLYTPQGLTPNSMFYIPRWTATIGAAKAGSEYGPAAMLDYRVTNKYGLSAGVINKTPVVGLSIRFGGSK